jgi:hypothetical protein
MKFLYKYNKITMGLKYTKYKQQNIEQPNQGSKSYFSFNFRERITSSERRRKEDKSFVRKIRKTDQKLATALEKLLDRIETGRESRADSTESRRGIGAQFYNIIRNNKIKPYDMI